MRLAAFIAFMFGAMAGGWTSSAQADDRPGEFDYYTLALSWSPTYCESEGRSDRGLQCSGERPYAFVVHGLWPQYNRRWPENCRTRERPWVPQEVIDRMLDIMPSKRLIIHQYRKHGTCSGLTPEQYFDASRRVFESIIIPEQYRLPEKPLSVSPDEVEAAFLKANPKMDASMISISCNDRRLRELRICFSRDLKMIKCGVNENQAKLCSRDKLIMPPVR